MAAAYDTYDYPSYWIGREYEHESEIIAIKSFLNQIPKINNVLEIGAGYGRLLPAYIYRARKVVLTDPSAKLLKIASNKFGKNKKIKIIQSKIENLPGRIRSRSFDLVIMVRVLHHIEDLDKCLKVVNRVLTDGGYFILEFANKSHLKATFSEFSKGNFTFPIDIFPKDIRSKKSLRKGTLPFINYHPDVIEESLEENGFEVINKRSVSNIRSPFFKSFLSLQTIVSLEKQLQRPFSYISFGPSIFVLAKKIS